MYNLSRSSFTAAAALCMLLAVGCGGMEEDAQSSRGASLSFQDCYDACIKKGADPATCKKA